MCHILIIEDETLVAMDLRDLLKENGATSFSFAATQADAIDQACTRRPAMMTSDVNLLDGTGPAAVRIIRDRLGMIPVPFITGTPGDCTPNDCDDVVFSKPFDRADVATAFREITAGIGATPIPKH